jgi:hypothetical protein
VAPRRTPDAAGCYDDGTLLCEAVRKAGDYWRQASATAVRDATRAAGQGR